MKRRKSFPTNCAGPGPIGSCTWPTHFAPGWTLQQVFDATKIDPWFLAQIGDLLREEALLAKEGFESLDLPRFRALKRKGFSDSRIAKLTVRDEAAIRSRRRKLGLHPVYKRVDTCRREFATSTAYLYSTYEEECEANPSNRRKIMILGGRPQSHRPGHRIRLLLRARGDGAARGRLRDALVNCNLRRFPRITTRRTACTSNP